MAQAFSLESTAFSNGQEIPSLYTCDGKDISPAFQWKEVPQGTKAYAFIMNDPDAAHGSWIHWALFNIPKEVMSLPEGIRYFPPGVEVGKNSWGRAVYNGPCPPSGKHHYVFTLYALKASLSPPEILDETNIEKSLMPFTLGKAQWIGWYEKSS